jgi:YD repeat-containing protein
MTYDAFDHLIESISPEGIRSRSTYDANNNKLTDELVLDDSHSVKTIYGYNLLDKPIIATSDISDTLT